VNAAGFSTTGSRRSTASWIQPMSSASSSVWRRSISTSSGTDAASPAPMSASVSDPYTSGSREPRRPRLGPFSTRIVVMLEA
jgi:hypothetical protein